MFNTVTLTTCLVFVFLGLTAPAQELDYLRSDQTITTSQGIVIHHSLLEDEQCNYSLSQIKSKIPPGEIQATPWIFREDVSGCIWTRIDLIDTLGTDHRPVLYFPKGWYQLFVYELMDFNPVETLLGTKHHKEYHQLSLAANDTLTLFIKYPSPDNVYISSYGVRILNPSEYARITPLSMAKFVLIGFLTFPLLYFLVVYLLERERIILAYLLFLVGAATNLITMLDTIAIFELTPKVMTSIRWTQRMFLAGAGLCLISLMKYIHYLVDTKTQLPRLYKMGTIIATLLLLVTAVPFFFPGLFEIETYGTYLLYYRPMAFVMVAYIVWICLASRVKKIRYSRILIIAFSPFLISVVVYALSFILIGQYSKTDLESILLIGGFYLTTLLFGVILGVRNNEVKAAKIRLEEETTNLRELDQFKSRFYTNFTHEFRTPLTVISGVADQIDGNERERILIKRNSKKLLNTVNDLLSLSKLESNHLDIDWVLGDIIPFLNYVTESCSSLASEKGINLAFFSKESAVKMDYDPSKLQQILLNLLSNAIKFTPEYGTVKVIAGLTDNHELRIDVSDTGPGIPDEDQPHIFDRFYQLDHHKDQGTGIGLSLVRELVALLDGELTLQSSSGRGSVFSVYLPVHQYSSENSEDQWKLQQEVLTSSSDFNQIEITDEDQPILLVIEDNLDVMDYIVSCLTGLGNIQTARNGTEGLAKAFEIIPDLVITDVMMPEKDGFEVCETLKLDVRTSHIPVMMLTAKATSRERIDGLKKGADAYLTKPFNKEELLIRCANLFEWSKRLRSTIVNKTTRNPTERGESEFISKLDELITNRLDNEEFNTQMLCRDIGMSRTQLHRKIKALTGISTASYIRKFRMDKALELLQQTDIPIGEIAHTVGFRDFSHFSRTFAKTFGNTPSESRV